MNEININTLIGKTLQSINGAGKYSDEITFIVNDKEQFKMYHSQDCCEGVLVEDISGDINDLINTPILQAEESTNNTDNLGREDLDDSHTWTFYRLTTIKGQVVIRWLGESNGYYSESISFVKL